jgi:hypothetical protein
MPNPILTSSVPTVTFDLRPVLTLSVVWGSRLYQLCLQVFVGLIGAVLTYEAIWGEPRPSLDHAVVGFGLVVFLLSLFLILSFRFGPQADQLKIDVWGVTFERAGTARRRVSWDDSKLEFVMDRVNIYNEADPEQAGKPTHKVLGIFPAATYVTPAAFQAILRSAKGASLTIRERPSPQDRRWTRVFVTPSN